VDGPEPKARPIAYKTGRGVMIAGVRTIAELRAIADFYEQEAGDV